ncbi:hypothetical protein [Paenibacillus sp. sgz302251]|uniref:hypothetical protein n=1 Tax=Paenibacillus sp. sgz302251 TaxID=3414493 RepID=UPI003C7BD0EF
MRKVLGVGKLMLMLFFVMLLYGCSIGAAKRSPEEWLSLSYSGLAATDQYAFTGSTSMKTADGLEFKPETFQGKVVDHQQLTVQTSNKEPLHWNPLQVLESLNNSNAEVRLINDPNNPETVTLHITEKPAVSKEKWKKRLLEQLDQLGTNEPSGETPYKEDWLKELARSRKQLENRLASMQAKTEYELIIDRNRILPLKMDEKTVFSYINNGRKATEERFTTVRFQAFDGTPSGTIQ